MEELSSVIIVVLSIITVIGTIFILLLIIDFSCTTKGKFFCMFFGWHKRPKKINGRGINLIGKCPRCGKEVIQDSQGIELELCDKDNAEFYQATRINGFLSYKSDNLKFATRIIDLRTGTIEELERVIRKTCPRKFLKRGQMERELKNWKITRLWH